MVSKIRKTKAKVRRSIKAEVKLVFVAIGCALLLILGHAILAKELVNQRWTEYTAAAIPFILFGIGAWAIRYASRLNELDNR
ncbi:hypothetical protein L4D09_27440 [Photobacterium makurazakiensis]|uniref:hypothetical protein n=1 Tax=Photobacterium makurazakiensis TaxID=2910234 RepID=UPI003D14CAD5